MPSDRILIEFTAVWGHPTRNEIYGRGQRVYVSRWAAAMLVPHYARYVEDADAE